MPVDQELIARRTIKLKLGESVHRNQKLVLVAIGEAVELLPLWPHEREVDAMDSYLASKLRSRRHRRKRLEGD